MNRTSTRWLGTSRKQSAGTHRLRHASWKLLSLEDRLAPAIVSVHIFNDDFSTNVQGQAIVDAKISVGDTVHWIWDQGKHSTTSAAGQTDSWDSGLTNQKGFTFDHTFTLAGVFNYYCSLHGADTGGGQVSGMAGTVTVGDATVPPGPVALDPLTQPRFVNALPIPSVMQPTTPGGTHYEVPTLQVQQNLGLINPSNGSPLLTTVWGYNGTYPAATIEATRDVPITVNWTNQLISGGIPLPHLLAESLMMPIPASGVPVVTHLHGGHTESASDGIPEAWFTPNFTATGPDFRQQTYQYDNDQPAATLWYHDHAEHFTPHNVYAGLAGFYILREPWETALNLPSGAYEIPLVVQDRMFTDDGELVYPPAIMASGAVGNFILVNGKAWPSLEVEPRKYRFRMLNGSDSRSYNVSLSVNGGGTAPSFVQIGSDQGFLAASQTTTSFQLSPADRMDLIIDFSDPSLAGKTIILNNSAPAPFPGGTAPDPATVGRLMAFKVTKPLAGLDTSVVPTTLRALPDPGPSVATKQLLLSMGEGPMGFAMLLGTVTGGRMTYADPITETVNLNNTETWEFYNDTPVAHPIHIHQTQFLVVSHQGYTATTDPITGALSNIQLVGSPLAPRPEYTGPKDTIMVDPGEVLRVVAKFDRPGEYVWHCHMLTHENNDMMRPILVTPMLSAGDVSVVEGNTGQTMATFTVSINGPADFPVTVNYSTAAGTASAGVDYQSASGTVTIPLGATSATIMVPVNGDTEIELNETFFLNLFGATGGVVITDAQAQGTILGDDLQIKVNDGSAQRSRVTQLTVYFNSEITFAGAAEAAFQLSGPSGSVQLSATPSVVNNATQVLLTFTGAGTEFGSLADGLYTLTVYSNQIIGGLPGGDYTSALGTIHRLFGDVDGNRTVNQDDFIAFRNAFNNGPSHAFDFEGDGNVTQLDFIQFRNRFNLTL